ncbi:FAD-dependent monooxygenase [Microbispora sp. NBC_01389]|uniref:FAD-dependent monooxygenase n=1 Tax=Microbispora sp. NBC_01389 TaxID=2903584 RepID=UPI0032539743
MTTGDDVLVVGAGPVGLVVACELLQQSIPVRVIDLGRTLTAQSRANVIWPRNLELLDRIGVTGQIIADGHRLAGTAFHSSGRRIGTAYLSRMADAPYPFAVMISQNETERILRRRLADLGGTVEDGVSLTELRLSGPSGRPVALLAHPDGRGEEAEPGWLVGADGAHSAVRKQLGIGYAGRPVDVTFAIADAGMTTALDDDLSHYCWSPRGAMAVGPMGHGVFRLAVNVPHGLYDDAPPPPEMFQRMVDERAGGGRVDELLWSATFRVRCRVAETFRSGRCFLAGDAAHIVSPAGGQGMNTGIQDACNLAWKLAGVIGGRLPESILDTYDSERRDVSHQVARNTAMLTRAGIMTTPLRTAVRDMTFRVADRIGVLQRRVAPQLGQTDISYGRRAHPGRPVPVGARVPVLISASDEPTWIEGWPAVSRDRYTLLVRGRSRPSPASAVAVLDLAGRPLPPALERALGTRDEAVLVRPDGHLAARLHRDTGEAREDRSGRA